MFGWGHLKDHFQPCDDCDETGRDDAEDPDSDNCPSCGGEGKTRWGSFYTEDVGDCTHCGSKNVSVSMMYEGGGCMEDGWVCIGCYIKHHREACAAVTGCALWKDAEYNLNAKARRGRPALTLRPGQIAGLRTILAWCCRAKRGNFLYRPHAADDAVERIADALGVPEGERRS